MKATTFLIFLIGLILGGGLFFAGWTARTFFVGEGDPLLPTNATPVPTPLVGYSITNLSLYQPLVQLSIGETIEETDIFTKSIFSLEFTPDPNSIEKKTTSGQLNIPKQAGTFPVIVMFRGYVDPEIYRTGMGTERAAEVFAENGFITLSPDFLGYADSDENSADIFESRFQTYTTAISVIDSIDQIDKWDGKNIFLWGHSNGGHIALALLEITKKNYPTTLWAPVSKSFPFSILYYTDESADKGRFIRAELAKFEELYEVDDFSIHKYFSEINSPIQIHQGGLDDAIPVTWSESLKTLIESDEDYEHKVDLYIYPEANHNLMPDWETVVARDLEFYRKNTN